MKKESLNLTPTRSRVKLPATFSPLSLLVLCSKRESSRALYYRELRFRELDLRKLNRSHLPRSKLGFVRRVLELPGFIGEPNGLVSLAASNDAVVEGDVRGTAAKFAHLKAVGGLVGDVESLAVALGRQEDVIFHAGVDGLCEDGFQLTTAEP